MRRLTEQERGVWQRAKRHGYAHVMDGQRMILTIDARGATILAPLETVAAEVAQKPVAGE